VYNLNPLSMRVVLLQKPRVPFKTFVDWRQSEFKHPAPQTNALAVIVVFPTLCLSLSWQTKKLCFFSNVQHVRVIARGFSAPDCPFWLLGMWGSSHPKNYSYRSLPLWRHWDQVLHKGCCISRARCGSLNSFFVPNVTNGFQVPLSNPPTTHSGNLPTSSTHCLFQTAARVMYPISDNLVSTLSVCIVLILHWIMTAAWVHWALPASIPCLFSSLNLFSSLIFKI